MKNRTLPKTANQRLGLATRMLVAAAAGVLSLPVYCAGQTLGASNKAQSIRLTHGAVVRISVAGRRQSEPRWLKPAETHHGQLALHTAHGPADLAESARTLWRVLKSSDDDGEFVVLESLRGAPIGSENRFLDIQGDRSVRLVDSHGGRRYGTRLHIVANEGDTARIQRVQTNLFLAADSADHVRVVVTEDPARAAAWLLHETPFTLLDAFNSHDHNYRIPALVATDSRFFLISERRSASGDAYARGLVGRTCELSTGTPELGPEVSLFESDRWRRNYSDPTVVYDSAKDVLHLYFTYFDIVDRAEQITDGCRFRGSPGKLRRVAAKAGVLTLPADPNAFATEPTRGNEDTKETRGRFQVVRNWDCARQPYGVALRAQRPTSLHAA